MSRNREVWELAHERTRLTLELGRSAIVDATHTEQSRRMEAIALYRSFGAQAVAAAVFEVPLHVALERNAECKKRGERFVPDEVIERMYTSLQQQPISYDEGFDKIAIVKNY